MTFLKQLHNARSFASLMHRNQRYGPDLYIVHLDQVRSVMFEFAVQEEYLYIAALLHDVLEDTGCSYEHLAQMFGKRVAVVVKAVSDPPGLPNRKERKEAVFQQLNDLPAFCREDAITLKLADRIANVRSCWRVAEADKQNKSLLGMYKKEYGAFRKALRHEDCLLPEAPLTKMWDELDRLLAWSP